MIAETIDETLGDGKQAGRMTGRKTIVATPIALTSVMMKGVGTGITRRTGAADAEMITGIIVSLKTAEVTTAGSGQTDSSRKGMWRRSCSR